MERIDKEPKKGDIRVKIRVLIIYLILSHISP